MKNIELPRKVIVGDGAIEMLKGMLEELDLQGNSLVISDPTTKEIAGDTVRKNLDTGIYIIEIIGFLSRACSNQTVRVQ